MANDRDCRGRGSDGASECGRGVHVCVDLMLAGAESEQQYPGIAAHLLACGPCSDDFEGLLAAVRGSPTCPFPQAVLELGATGSYPQADPGAHFGRAPRRGGG